MNIDLNEVQGQENNLFTLNAGGRRDSARRQK